MWSLAEWKSASKLTLHPRSPLMQDIDKTVQAYDEIKAKASTDLHLRIYALSLVIAAIDRWFKEKGRVSKRLTPTLSLYNQAKIERAQLKSQVNMAEIAEQQQRIAEVVGAIGAAIQRSQPKPAPPVPQRPAPLSRAQKQEINDSMTKARKQLLETNLGQHLLGELTKRRMQMLGMGDNVAELDAAERQELADDLPGIQLGYLTAKHILNVDTGLGDRKEKARAEGIRILAYMLSSNKAIAEAFFNEKFQVVVVPRQKYMTEVAEFVSLANKKTFDGRNWKGVRGAGYVFQTPTGNEPGPAVYEAFMKSKKKIFVAVTEENLTGEVFYDVDAGKDKNYKCGYSTTLHEFAHTIDRFALSKEQRTLLDTLFKKKRSDSAGNELKIEYDSAAGSKIFFDGSFDKVEEILSRQWADNSRLLSATWPNRGNVDVFRTGGGAKRGTVSLRNWPADCYAASHRLEYFAQTVCAYFGANVGNEPTTSRARNNGRAWVAANEPAEFLKMLDELFGSGRYTMDNLNLHGRPKEERWWEKKQGVIT